MPGVPVMPAISGALYGWATVLLTLAGGYLVFANHGRGGRRFSPRDIAGLLLLAGGAVSLGLYLSRLD